MNAVRGKRGHNVSRAHLADRAMFVRLETLRLARICGAGHYSSTFSAAELFAALYYAHLKLDPKDPSWPDRDRFVLSKGHAAIGLYPILADLGYYPMSDLDNFTRLGSPFGDHPNMKHIPGIDFSSGSLGHGLSIAVGMALAGRTQKRNFRVYCMLGDGELAEGQIWEAAMTAGHYKLGNLTAIVDRNFCQIDERTDKVMEIEPLADKWRAFRWNVIECDGHNVEEFIGAMEKAQSVTAQPSVVIAKTFMGKGVSFMEDNYRWHGIPPNEEQGKQALSELAPTRFGDFITFEWA